MQIIGLLSLGKQDPGVADPAAASRHLSERAFVDSIGATGDRQMDAIARFIRADPALRGRLALGAWRDVGRRHNGEGYGVGYTAKLRTSADVYAGRDAPAAPRAQRKGDRGADIVALQTTLGVRRDGYFGLATDAAVRRFQAKRGLVVGGIAGAMPRAALKI